jgi:hypothetical protein
LFSKLIGTGYPGVGTLNNKQDYAYVRLCLPLLFAAAVVVRSLIVTTITRWRM